MTPRLLLFCSDYGIGLTQLLTEQAIELSREKSIELFCISSEKEQEPGLHQKLKAAVGERITIIDSMDEHRNFRRLSVAIGKIIEEKRITHIHVQNNWQLALMSYLKYCHFKFKKLKIIYTIHGYRHNSRMASILGIAMIGTALLLFADRVICLSSYVSKKFSFLKYKTDIVFFMMNQSQYAKTENKISGAPLRMAFPAQFRKGKRQMMLVEALRLYMDRTGDRTTRLFLPGDGPLRDSVIQETMKKGLGEYVEFPGRLTKSDVLDLYESCNIALVSTNVETYGQCITEPFMLGRCLLTQKTGVAIDIIRDGENGMFFTDAESLAKILEDLHNHPEKVMAMGQQAFVDRKIFSRDAVMNSYLSALSRA